MKLASVLIVAVALASALVPRPVHAQAAANGEALFEARCKACHDPPQGRAPARAAIAVMPPAQIVDVLTSGPMAPMAAGLSPDDKKAIADYLTRQATPAPASSGAQAGKGLESVEARLGMTPPSGKVGPDPMCAGPAPPIRPSGSDWTSVGADPGSRRFQPRPGLTRDQVARLKVKWAFAMTGGGMPTAIGDWVFATNRNGKFYALDGRSGCVRWTVDGAPSRTTPMIVRTSASPSGWATVIGERDRTVLALDAQSGKSLWRSAPLATNPVAMITGSPVIDGDQVFVPMSSGEEAVAMSPTYPCCSFLGSLSALDLKTGQVQWKTHTISEPVRPLRKNAAGAQLQGPAGAAIWSAPTVDRRRGLVYVATGDSYTEAPTKGADAIMALETATGRIRWVRQVTEGDNYTMACGGPKNGANCPEPNGPDYDFGASPILFHLAGGKDMLLAGQKSGVVYGIDPDDGRLIWSTKVGAGSALGGVEWGMAADGKRLYVPIADVVGIFVELAAKAGYPVPKNIPPGKPGLSALDPATGKILWTTPAPVAPCHYADDHLHGACIRGQSAAPSVMPGVVISGTMDGWLRAYDAATGKILWAHSTTAQTYETVNGVKAQPGGSIDGLGAAIAGGRVYVMSGFNGAARIGGNGVNVLLAYSVDGR